MYRSGNFGLFCFLVLALGGKLGGGVHVARVGGVRAHVNPVLVTHAAARAHVFMAAKISGRL